MALLIALGSSAAAAQENPEEAASTEGETASGQSNSDESDSGQSDSGKSPETMALVDRPDEQFVIVEVRVPKLILAQDMPGYYDGERLFVPLWMFVDIVEFPIDVDVEEGRAKGWFLSKDRAFDLDLRRGTVELRNQEQSIDPKRVERHYDDIYVDMEAISEWFGLDYEFDFSLMRLQMEPAEPLPAQQRLERAKRRALLDKVLVNRGPRYELVPTPYKMWSKPAHDLRLEAALPTANHLQENQESRRIVGQSNSYHLRGAGDLFYMNGTWSISGTELHPISRARLRLQRKEPGGKMLGDLEATEIAVGDVVSPPVPLVARGSSGRGVQVSSFPLTRPTAFDYTTVSGPLEPEWEAELYRNDVLLDFQTEPIDGQFRFEQVPLLFGLNQLRIVMYGPHGEKRVERREVYIGPGMIRPGEQYYRVSVSQHNSDMVPIASTGRETPIDGWPRAIIEYERGLYDDLAVTGRFTTLPLRDEKQRVYGELGLRYSFQRAYTSLDVTVGDGWAMRAAAQTRLADWNFVAETAQFFSQFTSERFPNPDNYPIQNQTSMRIYGVLPVSPKYPVPMALRIENDYLGEEGNQVRASNRLSIRIHGVTVAHDLRINKRTGEDTLVNGALSARGRTHDVMPVAEASYSTDQGFRAYRLGALWRIDRDLQARANIYHEFATIHDVKVTTGVAHRLQQFAWGADIGVSLQGGFSIGASLSTGIGYDPRANQWQLESDSLTASGTVLPRVYWDKNQNGTYDEEHDEAAPDAKFFVNNSRQEEYKTDEDGVVVLPDVPADEYVDIELSRRSLYDPFFVPSPEGYTVLTRPGAVTYLDFPIIMTGEVDGTVWIELHGMRQPAAGVEMQLVDADGEVVDTTETAFDGFYLFDFIEPGAYTVRVSPEQWRKLRFEQPDEHAVEIGVDGTVVSGQDIALRRPDKSKTEDVSRNTFQDGAVETETLSKAWADARGELCGDGGLGAPLCIFFRRLGGFSKNF
ncbi:hypothetical protein FIV42_11815 [Persicimonas caeni]|uniref:SD-repeat containing protein B domain-containing protein n=1 Tax=Persicimonas caeni TaxID=2292766 RepID=A0A4Y6PSW6_PERCE|nr:SdrD B-like domain-containing protein [Persicimonas caeni]QDG51402.1 hypothetical protein FIV42_11815 [Persicimonas caeni]QED32623.1 hypothetical protein FRD00_11810 [Persicimonas caeni]